MADEEHRSAIETAHKFGVDVENFQIFLFGTEKAYSAGDEEFSEPGIEYQLASRFIINITTLSDIDPIRPITIHMKTCGGYDEEGMAVYDAICACPNYTTILSYTHARSMSLTVLQAAKKRVLMPHSCVLFHEGSPDTKSKTLRQQRNVTRWSQQELLIMLEIYARRLQNGKRFRGKSLGVIKRELKRRMEREEDVRLNAYEAVEWGFADKVFDFNWDRLRKPSQPRLVRARVAAR